MPNVAESFLRGHSHALAEKQQEQDQAERDIRKAVLTQQLKHEKLQDMLTEFQAKYKAAGEQNAATSGLPEASYAPNDIQGGYPLDRVPNTQGLDLHSKPLQLTPTPTPGLPDLGIAPGSLPRQTAEYLSAAKMREELNKALTTPHALGPDQRLVIPAMGPTPVATGGPAVLHLQQKAVSLNGSPAIVDYDPATGKHYRNGVELTGQKIEPIPPQGLFNTPEAQADIADNAQQLVDGNLLPSTLSKRGPYNQILAEANRISKEQTGKPFNAVKLQLDYEGAKRFVGSLNGQQMLRFRGLAGSVVNTIDEVRRLGDTLKQSDIQKWNQVKRGTIQQLYGNTPESELAAQYVGAVNTLKEEFANLANGGYAPSDAAWKLANQQINENFGFKDLSASLSEVQRLIKYRVQAFNDLGPQTLPSGVVGPPAGSAAPPPQSTAPTVPGFRVNRR